MSERRVFNLAYGKRYIAPDKSERKTWISLGRMWIDDNPEYGDSPRITIRLDSMPCDPNFNGMISAFPHEPRNGNGKNGNDIDEIPF